ncbi:ATP-dependent nuclease [Halopiger aswanensis]|uniref:Putative ATP-dependent endonuclease of OLD family n=1 Tax=Halopiger aswanensis TaxID=148449 RepID=A0A419WJ58_9EURY|nr:AAA family ATPase [Halopiger aswanensis]RKD95499.1 putative ATP-dependent endonuclease of OLD family [Halopiger aswanensis]
MKVTRWKVNGYKSFAPTESREESTATEFEPGELAILIGKNNTGKSNLLDSFQDYAKIFADERPHRWHRDNAFNQNTDVPIEFNIEFILEGDEHEAILSELQDEESLPQEIVKEFLSEGHFKKIRHSFALQERDIHWEELETNFEEGWIQIAAAENRNIRYSPTECQVLQFERLPNVKYQRKSINRQGIGAIFPNPYRRLIRNETQTWETIEAFREPQNQQTAGREEDLESNGSNLVQVVNTLYNNHRPLFNQFRERYVSIMEGVTDVSTPYISGNDITIRIHEDEKTYDLKDISAGSKEILTLIAGIVSSQNDTSLLLVEEPELHVHPGAEQEIFELIQDICREAGIQVIVSTHSEVFVNRSEASSIARIERDESTTIRSVSEGDISEELTDLGYNKSGLLQSNAVVFVEGRSDKRVLTAFCRKLNLDPDENGIAFVELEGKENLKRDGRSLVKLLYSFDIPYLFVVDSDDQTPEEAVGELLDEINRSDGKGWWETSPENFYAWPDYSLESYLLDPDVVARADEFNMSPSDVKKIISEHEDVDDKAEVLERIYREEYDVSESETAYSKDRDGMYIANRMNENEVPGDVREVVEKIGGLVGQSLE